MEWQDKYDIMQLADWAYPIVSTETEMTHEQKTALFRKWKQSQNEMRWGEFAKSAQPTFGCDGAITVHWCGMWLCIEKDGYTHS